jgi:dephospho-CoA kinase
LLAVGVTGNIGSGKTTVCKIFEGLGIDVYYADAMAKRLYQTDSELKEGVLNLFGDASYGSNGELVRQVLSDAIYRDPNLREALNALVHPRVFADFKDWCDEKRALGKSYVIKEAAILFESGADKTVDLVIGVMAPLSLRLKRVIDRDGGSAETVKLRIQSQMPQEDWAERCDYLINNDGNLLLQEQVLMIHEALMARSLGNRK